jgi:hypothetical protein
MTRTLHKRDGTAWLDVTMDVAHLCYVARYLRCLKEVAKTLRKIATDQARVKVMTADSRRSDAPGNTIGR